VALIRAMLRVDPRDRPTAAAIVQVRKTKRGGVGWGWGLRMEGDISGQCCVSIPGPTDRAGNCAGWFAESKVETTEGEGVAESKGEGLI
jgi:hypothetical protein